MKTDISILIAETPDPPGKHAAVASLLTEITTASVLDVGARGGGLSRYVEHESYVSVDLIPPADVVVNCERGLPFVDGAFNVVFALDVLEHTNDIHSAFSELCRTSSSHVVLSLPNLYVVDVRLKLLRGHAPSGKYGLPSEPVVDRHRWFFSLNDAAEFCRKASAAHGFEVVAERALVGRRRASGPLAHAIGRWPNLLAPTYVAVLKRKSLASVIGKASGAHA